MADTLSIDLTSLASFEHGQPWEQYRWLHEHAPVWWHPEPAPGPERPGGEAAESGVNRRGFWAVTRYADVQTVSRDPKTFSSWLGGIMLADSDPELLAGSRLMMLYMDPPDHTRYRRLVSRSFTPRAVQAWRERIEALATRLVDRVAAAGRCDLVTDLAGEIPSLVIAELMGIPGDDGRRLYHLTEIMHSADPALTDAQRMGAVAEMLGYASSVAAAKRAHPADDLATALVQSQVDGERLSDDDFNWFFLLLINAGGDTTRNLVGGGVEALLAWPDQLARWQRDPEGLTATAVEELLRFVSPVVHMRRTATTDTVLGGEAISAGDKVVVFYGAANRDRAVFSDPDTLDLARSPNPHLAFGAGGPHMCLGAHVARLEAAALLREIVTRLRDLRLDGPIERLDSTFIAGPRHLPVAFEPES